MSEQDPSSVPDGASPRRDFLQGIGVAFAGALAPQASLAAGAASGPAAERTAAETLAAVSEVAGAFTAGDVRRYGARVDNATDDTNAVRTALKVGSQSVSGAYGGAITSPTGTVMLPATVSLPSRVRVVGLNKRGSVFKAATGFAGQWMFNASTGGSSMFDQTLEHLTVDANNIAGLGCVFSDSWQEGCGLRNALLMNFATAGVRLKTGYGGAALTRIQDAEIFGGTTAGAVGIDLQQISQVGAFMLHVSDSTIAGGAAALERGVNVAMDSLHLRNVHFEHCNSAVYLNGSGNHVLIGVTGGPGVTNLIELAPTFSGSLTAIGCFRNNATNFLRDSRPGGLGVVSGHDITQLTISAGDPSVANRSQATAAAWCVFDGTRAGTNAATNGFNVKAVTRTSAGSYRIDLIRTMASSNCAVVANGSLATSGTHVRTACNSTSSVNVFVYANGVLTDSDEIKVVVFGS